MTPTPQPETTSAALWVVLARAYHAMAAFVEQSIAALNIGLSDFMILEALLHKGPSTMSALCQSALLANASMTAAIDRLTALHFVERTPHPTDRRIRLIQLTPSGATTIKHLYAQHLKDLDDLMAAIPLHDRAITRATLKTIGLTAQSMTTSRANH